MTISLFFKKKKSDSSLGGTKTAAPNQSEDIQALVNIEWAATPADESSEHPGIKELKQRVENLEIVNELGQFVMSSPTYV